MISQVYHTEAKLSGKNQIVIPKQARKVLNIRPKSRLLVTVYGDKIYLTVKPADWIKKMRGAGKKMWRKMGGGDHYLKKERASWD